VRVTIKEIDNAKPRAKKYKLADSGGLCLLIAPSGAKLWRWRYRFDGKEKMMALGEYPLVSLKEARERHFEARKTLAAGVDPMAERKAEIDAKQREVQARQREAERSFESVARKWWEWWSIGKSPRDAKTVLNPSGRSSVLQSRANLRAGILLLSSSRETYWRQPNQKTSPM
jgi:hypothetical protein